MGKKQKSKICTKCHKRKLLSNFSFRLKSKNQRQAVCKDCVRVYSREWQKKNSERLKPIKKKYRDSISKEKHEDYRLRHRYGITLKTYNKMLKKQNGVCWICGRPPKTRKLSVDHSHKTGKVRGLLCMHCNRGLSWYKDKPELLRKAADYLEEFNNESTKV